MVKTKESEHATNGHVDKGSPEVDGSNPESADDGQCDLPIDRGWAWVVLGAAWINVLLTTGMYKVSGIVFVEIQKEFNSSSSVTSLISSLLNTTYSVTSMLVNTVALSYISSRQSVVIGAVLLFFCFVISGLANSIELIVFMQGCFLGMSQGLVLAPTYSLVAQYFSKRRGVANCFMLTGSSVGSLMFSFVIRAFVNLYGLSGTFLLIGGLISHIAISGLLMRPIETYKRSIKRRAPEQVPLTSNVDKDHVKVETSNSFSMASRFQNGLTHSDIHLSKSRTDSLNSPGAMRALALKNVRKRTVSEATKPSVFGSISSMKFAPSIGRFASNEFSVSSSVIDLSGKSKSDIHNSGRQINQTDEPEMNSTAPCACASGLCAKLKRVIDCRVMKRGLFLFFLVLACMLCSGSSMIMTFIPPLARDVGLSDEQSDFLITLISSVDIFSVLIWGIIADRDWIRKSNIIAITVITMGVVTFFVPFYDSYEMMVFFSVMYGVSGRLYFPLFPVVLVELFGLENVRSALGLTILFHSSFTGITMPISGLLRDVSGSYVYSFQLMATFLVVGGVGTACLPLMEKCVKRWRQRSDKRDITITV